MPYQDTRRLRPRDVARGDRNSLFDPEIPGEDRGSILHGRGAPLASDRGSIHGRGGEMATIPTAHGRGSPLVRAPTDRRASLIPDGVEAALPASGVQATLVPLGRGDHVPDDRGTGGRDDFVPADRGREPPPSSIVPVNEPPPVGPPAGTGQPPPPPEDPSKAALLPNPTPTLWNVTGEELVENRMADLFDSGSPVLQAWQEATRRMHARYGGQNSLMANQAAFAGLAEIAFQIASTDAATIARSREFNAAMANQYGLAAQTFRHNAMLSEQNFRQAQIIQREALNAELARTRMQVSAQMAAINADMTIAREGFAHQIEMAGVNFGYAESLMGTEYGLMMGRDTNLADLEARNTLFSQTTQADLNLRNESYLAEQGYQHNLGTMYYGAELQDWRADQDFQRQRTLNYDEYRIRMAGDAASLITNLRIQPGMSDAVVAAGVNDLYGVWNSVGLIGDGYYLNGMSNDDSYPDYFTYPPYQRGRTGGGG